MVTFTSGTVQASAWSTRPGSSPRLQATEPPATPVTEDRLPAHKRARGAWPLTVWAIFTLRTPPTTLSGCSNQSIHLRSRTPLTPDGTLSAPASRPARPLETPDG